MPYFIRYICFLLLCWSCNPYISKAQEYNFKHLTMEEGMLSELRITMTEDRQGRMWMASDEGINIFDGVELSAISLPGNSGLLTNKINQIFCDRKGTIWIGTGNGIQYKKEKESKFITLRYGKDSLNNIRFFEHGPDSGIIATSSNACYYITSNFKISKLTGLDTVYKAKSTALGFYHFGGYVYCWGFAKQIVLANVKTQKIVKIIPYREAWSFCKLTDTTMLVGSFAIDSMFILNIKTGRKEHINHWRTPDGKPMGGYAATILPVAKDKYAVGCRYYGVYIIDVKQKSAIQLTHDPSNPSSLKSIFCRRLFITRNGFMFVHTRGLSYTSIAIPQFKKVSSLIDSKGEKYEDSFNDFVEDGKGGMWIGTNSFLAHWNRTTGISEFYPYYHEKQGTQKFKTIRTVSKDNLGRIWVGTFGGGIGMLLSNGKYKRIEYNTADSGKSYPGHEIHAINTDDSGNFFVCANGRFSYFNPVSEKVAPIYNNPKLKKLSRQTTYYCIEDNKGKWWIAQRSGLRCYDRHTDELVEINLDCLTEKEIFSLSQDSNGTIYAGSYEGLLLINPTTYKIERKLTKHEGLTSDYITGIIPDLDGNMWILGNAGLARYKPGTSLLESFTSKDGIEQGNHNACNYYLAKNGELFIGSSRGFNHFFPGNIRLKNEKLPLFITGVELADSIISMPGKERLELRYFQNNVTFSYLATDYNLAPYIHYRYKLKGFDTTFITAGKSRKARYTNLPAGKYKFIVQASPNGHDWYAAIPVKITIKQAIWNRSWFVLLVLSFTAAGVYLIFRMRVRSVRARAKKQTAYEVKLNEMENNALRTQMNPHFIFNSLNTINAFINSNDKKQANEYISKFSRLIRLILDHSRQRRVSLSEELEALNIYIQIEQIRFSNKFDYILQIDNDIDAAEVEIPSLMIQPFVENAILHGLLPLESGGKLTMSLVKEDNILRCEITDNGIGREKAMAEKQAMPKHRKSHGLDITLKRIELFNKENGFNGGTEVVDLKDNSGQPAGTKVIIRLVYVERF